MPDPDKAFQIITVRATTQFLGAGGDGVMTIRNQGPQTVYYGDANVSSSSFTGQIASGSVASIAGGQYVVSAGVSVCAVRTHAGLAGDYYVDSVAGNDSNDGLSTVTPVKTLAKLQTLLAANKTGVLKRGSRFTETLTLPADGITIGAYGSNVTRDEDGYDLSAPVLDGGTSVSTWSSYSGGVSDSYLEDDFSGTTGAAVTTSVREVGTGSWSNTLAFTTAILTSDGCVRRAAAGRSQARHAQAPTQPHYAVEGTVVIKSKETVDRCYLMGHVNTPAGDAHNVWIAACGDDILRIGYYFDSAGTGSGTQLTGDAFTFTVGNAYRLRIEFDEGSVVRGYASTGWVWGAGTEWDPVANPLSLINTANYSSTGVFDGAGLTGFRLGTTTAADPVDDAHSFQLSSFKVEPLGIPAGGATPVNTYQATVAAEPYVVTLRGSYSPRGQSVNTLTEGQSYWTGGTLYVRSNVGTPSNTDVVRGNLDKGINCGSHSNVTIQDVAFENHQGSSIFWSGAASNLRIRRCMAQHTGGNSAANGVFGGTATGLTDFTVESSIIRFTGLDGLLLTAPVRPTVRDCRIGPCLGTFGDCTQIDGTGTTVNGTFQRNFYDMRGTNSPKGGLILFGSTFLVEDCYFTGGNNFGLSLPADNTEVRRCTFYRSGPGGACRITDNTGVVHDNHLIHHNVFIDCKTAIYAGFSTGGTNLTNLKFYANTIYNNNVQPTTVLVGGYGTGQVFMNTPIGGEFKNNIIWNSSGAGQALTFSSVTGTWASNFNMIGPESANFITYGGTNYSTVAAYAAGKSQDAQSIPATAPGFKNAGGTAASDYAPRGSSRAIGNAATVSGIATNGVIGAIAPDGSFGS